MKKVLILLICFGFFSTFAFADPPKKGTTDPVVKQVLVLESGEIIVSSMTLDAFAKTPTIVQNNSGNNVVWCTYKFSNGDCEKSASSCAKAKKLFEACACNMGIEHYCPQQAPSAP